jgi:hypothetical protein
MAWPFFPLTCTPTDPAAGAKAEIRFGLKSTPAAV